MEISVKTKDENEARVAEEYLSSLSDLTCNSKPLINMLTMLAEENIGSASVIVKVVEQHIAKVPPDIKLPLLYLIDSIVKNVKSTYIHLFSQCIVNIFCDVFEKVNEKIRERMYALRLTWNDVFPSQKLYALDVKVKRIDNNWPITAKQVPPSIHVNPNFLKPNYDLKVQGDVEEILQAKTRELLELKKRKLELELEATKKSLEEQDKQLSKVTNGLLPPETATTMGGSRIPGVAPPIMAPGLIAQHHMHPRATHPVIVSGGSAVPPTTLFHSNFSQNRPQHPHMPVGMMSMPPQNFSSTSTAVNKPKVHPVNPALLNTIRHRDPRLARQQQMQDATPTMRGSSKSSASASLRCNDDIHKSDTKSSSSSSSYRNGSSSSSKSSRSDSGGNAGAEIRRKGSSSRDKDKDKDKDRKRSESKSSTSSGSSCSSERQKGSSSIAATGTISSRSSKKLTVSKCDKDAFEIAPLSTAFKRKSSTISLTGSDATSSRKKELKRKSHSTHTSPSSKNRSRSRSPIDKATAGTGGSGALSDRDDRQVFATKKQPKSIIADVEYEEELKNAAGLKVENKTQQPTTTVALDSDDELSMVAASTGAAAAVPANVTKGKDVNTTTAIHINMLKNETSPTKNRIEKVADDDDGGGGNSVGGGVVSASGGVNAKRHSSIDIAEQQLSKHKAEPLPPNAMEVDKADSDEKKRSSTSSADLEAPMAKKLKQAKFDALFGDEDVDLRTCCLPPQMLAVQQLQQQCDSKSPTPPPPPFITDEPNAESWNNLKTSKNTKATSPTKKPSTLDDVRAKLAKATKYSKFNKSEKPNKDITQRVKLSEAQLNDDSQDANDEKIRTIVAQAQELLEANSINQDQYKNLMQKVMSINETSKLKEAKKRESLGGSAATKSKQTEEDEESVEEQRAAAAREAVLKKRIPKLRRPSANTSDNNASNSTPATELAASNSGATRSPIYDERSNDNSDASALQRAKPQREKRLKPTKWGEKVDGVVITANMPANPNQPKPWTKGNMMRPHSNNSGFRGGPPINMPIMHPQMSWQMQMPPVVPPGAPPFVNPGPMIRSSVPPPPQAPMVPIIPLPPNIPKPCNSIDNPQADLVRSITIDGLSKEIRIYDQVAIVFMELDQPREIGFQAGQRSIIIDDETPIALQFNDDYKIFSINGQPHRLRFGFPSRELYIDDQWYEIYFGGPPVSIPIQNRIHILKAEGPPPQVNIGALRRDLVVGKINMIVDAHIVIPLFLDAKAQSFKLGNQEHTVQFADNLLTVLLDGEPAKVEYGGLPKSYVLGGISYFIRFGALPEGLKAGQIVVKDMIYVKTEPKATIAPTTIPAIDEPLQPESTKLGVEDKPVSEQEAKQSNIDLPVDAKLEASIKAPATDSAEATGEVGEPQVVGTAGSGSSAIPIFSATALNKINIDELFQKLVSSGILGGAGNVIASSNKDAGVLPSAAAPEEEPPQPIAIRPIDLTKTETIKTRQMAIVDTLFSGMQCSSCGVRFPPEQTIKYSQHLDWHFRQNRRERDLSRKAHSRKWYYDLADWVQYEEIEDLEEREKNFFEAQQNDVEATDETSNQKWLNSPAPLSCPALPEDVDRACDMCQEKFEQFYHEETEEWHLRNAVRVEDKIYHPLCYEDYKAALNAKVEETEEPMQDKTADEANTDDDVIIKIEGDDHSDAEGVKATDNTMDDDDDDVIVLPNEEPSVTEIDDDDEYVPESVPPSADKGSIGIDTENDEPEIAHADADADEDAAGSDVEIQEPHIPFTDLDTYVEKQQPDVDETSQLSFLNVKIKEEPKDDDEDEDDGFEDVGTVLIAPDEEISIQSSEETQTQTIASSTSGMSPTAERPPSSLSLVQVDTTEFVEGTSPHTVSATPIDLNTSIDGNPGSEDEHNLSTVGPSPAIPLASLVNKIKINIAKSSITANNSSTSNNSNSNNGGSVSVIGSTASVAGQLLSGQSKGSIASDAQTGVDNGDNNTVGAENTTTQYSNVSAISVVSTIPVLCGGGTTGVRTTTLGPVVSGSSAIKNIAANEESNVSTISVIGSYGSTSSAPRYFPPSTTSTAVPTVAKRQTAPPTTATPPPPQEETITYELKPALQNVKLTKTKKVKCGTETSGLCSIM